MYFDHGGGSFTVFYNIYSITVKKSSIYMYMYHGTFNIHKFYTIKNLDDFILKDNY